MLRGPSGGSGGHQDLHMNPNREGGSKPYHTSGDDNANPSAPPKQRTKKTKKQGSIHDDVLQKKTNLFVPNVKSIDIEHMHKDPNYIGEALALCDQVDITRIMRLNKDVDAELVDVFYATIHLGTDDDSTLT
ncbi:hypothetical protein D1007_45030 [Hordeum vulgare]|nr:hypothetical protein D1007_45030 [Hordeum vulgare]